MERAAEDRFSAFAAARGSSLLGLAWTLTGDAHAAQDLVQIALAKVYVAWARVEASGNPHAYVRRVLVNAATDRHRRRNSQPPEQLRGDPVEQADGTDVADQVVSASEIGRLLATLSAQQRAVLVLRFSEDLTEHDTAAALGISVGTVKSHTARALAHLRRLTVEFEETDDAQR